MKLQLGQTIEANVTASTSFYKKVKGVVTSIKGDFIGIQATQVVSRWSDTGEYKQHPTQCGMSVKISNIIK